MCRTQRAYMFYKCLLLTRDIFESQMSVSSFARNTYFNWAVNHPQNGLNSQTYFCSDFTRGFNGLLLILNYLDRKRCFIKNLYRIYLPYVCTVAHFQFSVHGIKYEFHRINIVKLYFQKANVSFTRL